MWSSTLAAEFPASKAVCGTFLVAAARKVQNEWRNELCRHGSSPAASAVALWAAEMLRARSRHVCTCSQTRPLSLARSDSYGAF